MSKILIAHSVNPYLFKTGSWIYNQIKFKTSNIEHIVLTTQIENLDKFPYDKIESLSSKNIFIQISNKLYRKIFNAYIPIQYNFLNKNKVDVLHSHFGRTGYQNIKLAKKLNVPHVVSFYGADMSKDLYYHSSLRNKYKDMFQKIDAVFVEGEYSKQRIIKLGCNAKKVHISHLGTDLSQIKMKKREIDYTKTIRILIGGTFTEKKGLIITLKALNNIINQNLYKSIEIFLIGDTQNTSESINTKKQLLTFINSNEISDHLKLLGFVSYNKLMELSYECHFFIQLSKHARDKDNEGGFPVIITDLMATGLPVIASKHCDIPEIVIHEKNGFIVPEDDIRSAEKAIQKLLNNYNTIVPNWLEFNKRFLAKEFNASSCFESRIAIYQNLKKKYI